MISMNYQIFSIGISFKNPKKFIKNLSSCMKTGRCLLFQKLGVIDKSLPTVELYFKAMMAFP